MIRLEKVGKPQVLIENETVWTARITAKLASGARLTGTEKTWYRHPEIKEALIAETHGKCAYCESKLLHIHHGNVDHIFPKSLDPARTVEWTNLTLACEICNQNKSNKDPYLNHIIDPYLTEPSEHLTFAGPMMFTLGTPAGISTSTLLDLNRAELFERRKEHLERIKGIFETVSRDDLPIPTRQALFRDLITLEAASSAPYSAMVRTVIDQLKLKLPTEITA